MMKWPLLIILMVMMMIITIDGWRNVERSTTPAIQPCDIGNWPHLLHHHHHHNVDIQDQPYHVKVVFFFFHKSNHKTHLKIEEAQYILHQYKKKQAPKAGGCPRGDRGGWRRLKKIEADLTEIIPDSDDWAERAKTIFEKVVLKVETINSSLTYSSASRNYNDKGWQFSCSRYF